MSYNAELYQHIAEELVSVLHSHTLVRCNLGHLTISAQGRLSRKQNKTGSHAFSSGRRDITTELF